ncbi:DUF3558 family protein [Amycolatopsis sp. K13G38]|uniref:DUF3558 family protein n=1 Tax=Amycolatopsis acididurans TaxID=2724524 RepID=A0ABX1JA49_9PSEU|nr:DUF3558 family protein [Amycolatopsis acididurans]NKQ55415.1 DUF3558 family protein [Amycolatopsis acididurans]
MRYRTLTATVAAGAALTAITACGSNAVSGQSSTTTSSSAASSTALPQGGAPNVTNPLDPAPLLKDMCAAPSQAQIETLGGPVKQVRPNSGLVQTTGPNEGCAFVFANGLGVIGGGPGQSVKYGLTEFYRGNAADVSQGKPPSLRELPAVDGYPTIQSTFGYEGPGDCITATGLSNTQVYFVKTQLGPDNPYYPKPCDAAAKMTDFAIQYLKAHQ